MTMWDVGGRERLAPLWRHYFQSTNGLVWVVDSSDTQRLESSADELHRVMADDLLKDAVFLILANKQDLPNAMKVSHIVNAMGLHRVRTHTWYVQPCSAGTGTGEGVQEGFDWLCNTLKARHRNTKIKTDSHSLSSKTATATATATDSKTVAPVVTATAPPPPAPTLVSPPVTATAPAPNPTASQTLTPPAPIKVVETGTGDGAGDAIPPTPVPSPTAHHNTKNDERGSGSGSGAHVSVVIGDDSVYCYDLENRMVTAVIDSTREATASVAVAG